MNWLCKFGIHKWSKFVREMTTMYYLELNEKKDLTVLTRKCEKCGLEDLRKLNENGRL